MLNDHTFRELVLFVFGFAAGVSFTVLLYSFKYIGDHRRDEPMELDDDPFWVNKSAKPLFDPEDATRSPRKK